MRYFLSLAIILSLVVLSCKNETDKKPMPNSNDCTMYACPMHPDHTSTVPAKCPVCGMQMDTVKTKKDSMLVR